jgi:hypothetical protein
MKSIVSSLVGLPPLRPKSGRPIDLAAFGVQWLALVLAASFILLHAVPQLMFPHRVIVQGIGVHADEVLPAETEAVVAEAAALVARSELAIQGQQEQVFVSDRPWRYRLFSPASKAFAFFMPLTNNIFVADGRFRQNISMSSAATYNRRRLSAVIAHEIVHHLIKERLGLVQSLRVPTWVAEGYCDYVVNESSFPETEGTRLIAEGKSDPSHSFEYFRSRKMIQYLVEKRHMTFEQIVEEARESDALRMQAQEALRREAMSGSSS